MRRVVSLLVFLVALAAAVSAAEPMPASRIAFGSCVKQGKPQPIWEAIVGAKPEMFLFIGDNIYGDSKDPGVLKAKWEQLGAEPGYQKLKAACPILATWDDHDYGADDAGAEYPIKKESQEIFLNFFDEPADSPRRKREGVYDAKVFGPPGKRVQVILLDTRYFRSPLVKPKKKPTFEPGEGHTGVYVPTSDPDATILGPDQWKWLAEQLRQPAEVRILASSIQVIAHEHGWEHWGNFPRERERLLKLIADCHAEGMVIISGDRHSAEISAQDPGVGYTLYDVTSSSLNQPLKWHNELNRYRLGMKYSEANFGTILIDWDGTDPTLRLQVRTEKGEVALQKRVRLSELKPKAK
jgi:alkaline phosphatase D